MSLRSVADSAPRRRRTHRELSTSSLETFRSKGRRTTAMSSSLSLRRAVGTVIFTLLGISLITGCASDHGPGRGGRFGGHEAGPPPYVPEMETHGTYVAGTIEVDVLLNRAGFPARTDKHVTDRDQDGRGPGGGVGVHGGADVNQNGARGNVGVNAGGVGANVGVGGGGLSGGLGLGMGGGGRHGRGEGRGGERGGSEEQAPRMMASNQPPVALHLRFTNHSSSPVEIEVPDFDSALGNFVVQPARITVPANGTAEAAPMISQLGVTSTEIPLTVSLRVNGQTEKQVLNLHLTAKEQADAAPSAPPMAP